MGNRCRRRGSNPHGAEPHWILSPARLPVPPLRRAPPRYIVSGGGCKGAESGVIMAHLRAVLAGCQRRKRIGRRGGVVKRTSILTLLVLLIGAFAFAAAGCGGGDEEGAGDTSGGGGGGGGGEVEPLPSASCTGIEFKGEGDPDVLIASDLPLQGSSRTQTLQIIGAIRQVLDQRGWKAGDANVAFQSCDDATAQLG